MSPFFSDKFVLILQTDFFSFVGQMETATSIFKGKVSLSAHETTDTFIPSQRIIRIRIRYPQFMASLKERKPSILDSELEGTCSSGYGKIFGEA